MVNHLSSTRRLVLHVLPLTFSSSLLPPFLLLRLFYIEGAITVFVALLAIFILPDFP